MTPSIDVCETDNSLQVKAELPGVDESDIDVELNGDILSIRGEKKSDYEQTEQNYHLVERSYGSFARSIRLPFTVDQDKVDASFDKGVLTITLPKPADAQKLTKKISVKRTDGQQASSTGQGTAQSGQGAPASGQ
ncbi:Hsp20/alpha crystallin family protein [Virgifigura deserti]|uniref:Hsp20/alpha crystallin family protein n=1 Tax=Virgifigura deserti TaxID=2268457 RepID=UPI003CCC18E7